MWQILPGGKVKKKVESRVEENEISKSLKHNAVPTELIIQTIRLSKTEIEKTLRLITRYLSITGIVGREKSPSPAKPERREKSLSKAKPERRE